MNVFLPTDVPYYLHQVKHWCKARGLNDAPNGTPSSYCHAVLVIFFLTHSSASADALFDTPKKSQGAPPSSSDVNAPVVAAAAEAATVGLGTASVLPNLQLLARVAGVGKKNEGAQQGDVAGALDWVEGFDCRYCSDITAAREHHEQVSSSSSLSSQPRPRDERTVPELLVAYFHWLNRLLDNAGDFTVSLRLGCLLRGRRSLWANGKAWRLSVEDPFESHDCHRPHDLGQVLFQVR